MNIKTRFNINDSVYFIGDNKKSCSLKVHGIKIEIVGSKTDLVARIIYLCGGDDAERVFLKVSEGNAYASKKELLESL